MEHIEANRPNIPKELEPLAQRAREFKTAKEFAEAYTPTKDYWSEEKSTMMKYGSYKVADFIRIIPNYGEPFTGIILGFMVTPKYGRGTEIETIVLQEYKIDPIDAIWIKLYGKDKVKVKKNQKFW